MKAAAPHDTPFYLLLINSGQQQKGCSIFPSERILREPPVAVEASEESSRHSAMLLSVLEGPGT